MGLRNELIEYSRDVIDGRVIACKKHRWACMRFLRDLDREDTPEFPYYFDEAAGERYLNWTRLFRHRKGVLKGQKITPHIIQKFVFGNIYGWKKTATGTRRFTRAYWQVGRKNAKSQSLSCVASYELMALGEGASEVYCAATKTDQAKIVWEETEKSLKACPELKGKFRVAYGRIEHRKTGSFMRTLSKEDGDTGDGLNPQCGIVDEYHAHSDAKIYEILDSGMVARPQPLLMIITTAGFNLANPCYKVEYKTIVEPLLDPNNPFEADYYFAMVNELDEGDDIKDEANWPKANPIVCSYPEGVESLRNRLKSALQAPEKMRDFLTKSMDIWIQMKAGGYIALDKWAACRAETLPSVSGLAAYVGVDLSAKIDLTAAIFNIPVDGKHLIISHFFMPEDTLQQKMRTDKTSYDLWAKQGWITVTPGAVVDYSFVKQWIIDKAKELGVKIREICYDPWNATQFAQDMDADGYTMVEIRQGIRTLGEATKDLREKTLEGKVIHDGNPTMDWMMGNAVTKADANTNIMLDKAKSTERIDGPAAAINAHVRAMIKTTPKKSVYETRGVRG